MYFEENNCTRWSQFRWHWPGRDRMWMLSVSPLFCSVGICNQDPVDLVGMFVINFNEIQVNGKPVNL